ncbi:hypothetical protein [Streptomyces sp. V2I9]|uniref:hypothetical protein n=1 Tax=Streptomyces sp. V2I9 TaxID=3042304 RepID=UPI00278052B6|nr:hypothetical protein [Streptomyces sp. V2I9]MDQ0985131.1 Na+-driven multidrug efflux pump [Streptomyces sp. V2I9]
MPWGRTSTLVGLGRSRLVMRGGLTGTATAVVLSPALVNGVGPLDGLGLPGAGSPCRRPP